jgi:hypothetical protein
VLSPLLVFAVPSVLAWEYQLLIQLTIGQSAPALIVATSLYLAFQRYKYLTTDIKGRLVTKLVYDGENKIELHSRLLNVKSDVFI